MIYRPDWKFFILEVRNAGSNHDDRRSDLFRSSTADFYRSFLAVKLAGSAYSGDMEEVKPSRQLTHDRSSTVRSICQKDLLAGSFTVVSPCCISKQSDVTDADSTKFDRTLFMTRCGVSIASSTLLLPKAG